MKDMNELIKFINTYGWRYEAIVVEGYDGVGKGKILSELSQAMSVVPYRPDYNLWQKYDHRMIDRWKVSGFFWDIFSHFGNHTGRPMLFDRGVLSGAVYAKNEEIAKDYPTLLRDMRVLHILVTCDKDSYYKFQQTRFREVEDYELEAMWEEYQEFTNRYLEYFHLAGVEYMIYENSFDDSISERLASTCEGCGHYSYGICRHPSKNCKVDPTSKRCEHTDESEVQDRDDSEVCCV